MEIDMTQLQALRDQLDAMGKQLDAMMKAAEDAKAPESEGRRLGKMSDAEFDRHKRAKGGGDSGGYVRGGG